MKLPLASRFHSAYLQSRRSPSAIQPYNSLELLNTGVRSTRASDPIG
ncbi:MULTISPECIES: hypothetical protein [unclassified Sinorhizobium]|nr:MULTISPECIES: hypothetical protein [unclassified Sinorhizobium]MDK1376455.1 hypothetical protein [Sinorhizobium sp. 6-70]MDK1480997.1 hypothetical protein [Sinorhizobium sp. 6-117]